MNFGHDSDGRLVSAYNDYFEFAEYRYDPLGRRVQRYAPGNRDASTKFTYDGMDVILDDDNGTLTKYQNGPGIDNKLSAKQGLVINYFVQDHLGSTDALTDNTGAVTSQARYDSFGNPTGNLATRYQFTGREYDSFTSLQYSRARFYDPKLGRFISEDPIGFNGGINLYSYVANQPLKYKDPIGWFPSLWPFDFHQRITRRALSGMATPSQIRALEKANGDYDWNHQDPVYAPQHAMTRPGQSPSEARAEANRFVRDNICLARRLYAQGFENQAMEALARAMHTVQDSASPAHHNFKEAWPNTIGSFLSNLRTHYLKENFDPQANSVADFQTRTIWDFFNGSPMPPDFFIDNYVDDIYDGHPYVRSVPF